jgi:hypothetical protein
MNLRISGLAAAMAILAPLAGACAAAPDVPHVDFVPINSHPAIPTGLKATCMTGPNVLTMSKTCPVVHYSGYTTWAYSFIDNRVSMALVTYDKSGKVVGNVTKNGARYVWIIHSGHTVPVAEFFGQSNRMVTAAWSELKPK